MKSLFRDLLVTSYWSVVMSEALSLESILSDAEQKEREYDWSEAAKSLDRASRLVPPQDFLKMGEIYERLGYAFYKTAMQAEGKNAFGVACHKAVENYGKSKEFYGMISESSGKCKMLRCDAFAIYVGYWLAPKASEKKRLLDDCWRLTKECLKAFEEARDYGGYGRTFAQLSTSALYGFFLERNFQARQKTTREAIEYGEKAIKFISTWRDFHELAAVYVETATYLEVLSFYFLDPNESERCLEKVRDYWLKAKELSEERAMVGLLSTLGEASSNWGEGTDKALSNFKKALRYGRKTKDKLVIGCALDWLAYHTVWKGFATEDQHERLKLIKKAFQYAENAKCQYSQISFVNPTRGPFWASAPHAEYYRELAIAETDLIKRRELLQKAVEASSEMLKRAENSGCPENVAHAHHVFSKALTSLAIMEGNSEEKKRLLEKALDHRNDSIMITEQLAPFGYWNCGIMRVGLASTESELAKLAKDSKNKKTLLQEAILEEENALKLLTRGLSIEREASVSMYANVGNEQYKLGHLLNSLYEFTGHRENLRKAAEAFAGAVESYQKTSIRSRTAECLWKAAGVYDDLGEHLKAAHNFDLASINYTEAAEKTPQLRDFYLDHALYMQAWSEIEKARHHHARQEYDLAKEHFEKTANIHKSLRQWGYLAPNYSAWVQVERGEELSRKEQSEEAIQAFKQAVQLFKETEKSLQTQLNKIENVDEKQMATNMFKATHIRHEYCTARIALEEAKILDKKGDHYFSSEKYGVAAETLRKIGQALESERDRKEIRFITNLSQAWQKMMLADARASPELYLEAAQLFEQASMDSCTEITGLQALGHSRFCKALEAGTRFADTRDRTMHAKAVEFLESAANYYVKAGIQSASDYAKATGLLFDAYVHMDNAKKEEDPEKKAKLYTIAEKVLQTSAGFYMKAEHPEKREQVMRLLDKVKEERELAISIAEVLHAPTIVSATTSFIAPTPTSEEAVGSERFEHADIQGSIIIRQKELKVGEILDLELELVNAGKGPALLTKVTEIIPKGFELIEKPEIYRVEDSYLNMKGKRLDPLKTEEVKLVLKPTVQGVFSLKPTVLYLDENGKYKSHEPEPKTIVVKELGIKNWLKGER